ncbi:MAG: SOS response-associated peptidase [Prolixibacteraceae bacterium]|jgi:putative SOS response-associated peptidase YedK|nr:SOS response-associated peptidase [Prolixibacteraceae bacterium]
MCFHSKQSKNAVAAEKRFNAVVNDVVNFKSSEHFNAFEFPKTRVITNDNLAEIQNVNWGLIPQWAKNDEIRKFTLNAKIETLTEKPSFRNSVNRRCLVLADGFYEWQWLDYKGKQKQKYLLTLPDNELFAYAGIWSEWVSTITGEIIRSYSIVTTEATGIMREIHNSKKRMPVLLTPNNEQQWLMNNPLNDFLKVELELNAQKIDVKPTGLLF